LYGGIDGGLDVRLFAIASAFVINDWEVTPRHFEDGVMSGSGRYHGYGWRTRCDWTFRIML
jgi:hypothetical protein